MVFGPPSWVPQLSHEIPDSIPVGEFALNGNTVPAARPPFIDAITGNSYSLQVLRDRVEWLARALAREFRWSPNQGSPWDKVVGIFSMNTIDYFVLCWAVHRLNGICLPIHSTSTVAEITTHMSKAQCRTIFTCDGLVPTCLEAANELGVPLEAIYMLELPAGYVKEPEPSGNFKSLGRLVDEGSQLEPLEPVKWESGQGKSQVAYLCATSGTSGKQKLAMITHYNIIANILQVTTYESFQMAGCTEVGTGAIPFTHSYGLDLGHIAVYRGDSIVVFPRFDMQLLLKSVPQYQVQRLYLVPPILAALAANPFLFQLFDLSSVTSVVTGAAALSKDLAEKLRKLQPNWQFLHAYGLTETCVVATFTSAHDIWHGSSGSVLPDFRLRIVGPDGEDIEELEKPGELLFKSPTIFAGYLGDDEANRSAFDADGWLRTGDVGLMKMGRNGAEHLFIVDRIKDMIKVKGMQVAPAEIENVLLAHPAVAEAAVIGVADELAGERPQAFIVRSVAGMADRDEEDLREHIDEHVQDKLHETHWLHERIVFLREIPKNQNGKVLKKELRAMVLQN